MSESPEVSGDDNSLMENKSGLIRGMDSDAGIDVIPAKRIKNDESVVNIDEIDDDEAVLEGDEEDYLEEDLDQGELVDGNEDASSDEAAVDDVGESSDIDDYIQANLTHINECQTEIDTLNKNANDEILKVAQKYNQLRQPIYTRRNNHIDLIPHFWSTVFSRHPQLKRVVTRDDLACLKHLSRIQINDFEEGRSGYQMKFFFSRNPWFSNTVVTKEYHLPWHDAPSCVCTPIDWYPGMDLTKKAASFFCWFCSQEDASTDDIAEIIKEELWPDPLQCYMLQGGADDESVKSVSDDQSGDEDVEYISSDDEAWKKRPAFGKEAPGYSKGRQYASDEEESVEEDERELDGQMSDREEYDENDADLLEDKPDIEAQESGKDDLSLLDNESSPPSNSERTSGKTKLVEDLTQEQSNDGDADDFEANGDACSLFSANRQQLNSAVRLAEK